MEDSTPSKSKWPVIVGDAHRSHRVERNHWQATGRWCAVARSPARLTCLPMEWAHVPSGRRFPAPSRGAVGVLLDEWPCVITADHTVGGPLRCGRGLAPGGDGGVHPKHQAAVAQ